MSAGRICNRVIATAAPSETLRTAAQRMAENRVGTVLVLDSARRPAGILTDRDIVVSAVAEKLDLDGTPISRVMKHPVHKVTEDTPIEEAISTMASAAARRLAVINEHDELVGVLALDDVLDLLIEEVESIGRLLEKQKPTIGAHSS